MDPHPGVRQGTPSAPFHSGQVQALAKGGATGYGRTLPRAQTQLERAGAHAEAPHVTNITKIKDRTVSDGRQPFNAGPSDPVYGGSGRNGPPYNRDVNKEHGGSSPAAGIQGRHEAIRASDAAHAASAMVAAAGHSATASSHTMAASAHLAAAGLADKAGHRLAMQGHEQLAAAHMAAAKGDHPGATKAFASYSKDSEKTHYAKLAETEGAPKRSSKK